MNNEIPLGRRSGLYRAFEMLPAAISYSMLALVVVLPLVSPPLAACYILAVVGVMFMRAFRSAIDVVRGYARLRKAETVDWWKRLRDLEDPFTALLRMRSGSRDFESDQHRRVLESRLNQGAEQLLPSDVYHAVIIAAYNEPYEVIAPTIQSLSSSRYDQGRMLIFFAYEERGGDEMARTARRLAAEFGHRFAAFELVRHPRDLPDEIAGKGANISFAGGALQRWVDRHGIDPAAVLVTTLDCDNKPHPNYFACAAYYFLSDHDRKRAAFQPMSLFLSNIWDAPAPSRVVASGNTFWNIISSVRPLTLRNFASHSQPLDALVEMEFWSTRTIVEDGHQYWRSYFHFGGDYRVVSLPVPIYQDAVLAPTYRDTLIAQFKQLSRWSYGASDVPFVGVRVFGANRRAPFWPSLWRFLSLLEGHVTLACVSIIIAAGGWMPFLLATNDDGRAHDLVENLPFLVGAIQQIAMIGLALTIVLAWRLLPARPERYGLGRSVAMLLQWLLFPITIIGYNAVTAIYSQGRLLIGAYRERFDVTVKSAPKPDTGAREPAVVTGGIPLPQDD